jgi:hypothetical protein
VRAAAAGFESSSQESAAFAELAVDLAPAARFGELEVAIAAQKVPMLNSARVTVRAMDRIAESEVRILALSNGVLRVGEFLAGRYEVAVDPGGWHFAASAVATVHAGEVTRIEVRPDVGGRIRAAGAKLRIQPAPLFEAIAQRDADGATATGIPAGATPYISDELLRPGRYLVWELPSTNDGRARSTVVEVIAGSRVELD